MSTEHRRLFRSSRNRVLAGVCGGLGEYFDVDPVLIRVAWVASVLLGGFGILLYLFWIFIVPVNGTTAEVSAARGYSWIGAVIGGGLVLFGALLLMDNWYWIDLHRWWHWSWEFVGPTILIALGIAFIVRSGRTRDDLSMSTHQDASPNASPANGPRRFQKSRTDRKMFGVCGGLAAYLEVDPTIVRLLIVGLTLAAPAVGILGYFAVAILAPTAQQADPRSVAGGV